MGPLLSESYHYTHLIIIITQAFLKALNLFDAYQAYAGKHLLSPVHWSQTTIKQMNW